MLSTGDLAPDFTLPREGGGMISLSGLRGQKVVLFFYPADDTPTCTIEAIDFTKAGRDFEKAGTVVIGISKDSVESHDKFCRKFDLDVILASDEGKDTCERYGVWTKKTTFGNTYMGIVRTTFLIDADGRIAQIWPGVKIEDHINKVLAAAVAL